MLGANDLVVVNPEVDDGGRHDGLKVEDGWAGRKRREEKMNEQRDRNRNRDEVENGGGRDGTKLGSNGWTQKPANERPPGEKEREGIAWPALVLQASLGETRDQQKWWRTTTKNKKSKETRPFVSSIREQRRPIPISQAMAASSTGATTAAQVALANAQFKGNVDSFELPW